MKKSSFCLCLIIFCSVQSAADGVYRWTDNQGKIHYSNVKPLRHDKDEAVKLHLPIINSQETVRWLDRRPAAHKLIKRKKNKSNKKEKWCSVLKRRISAVEDKLRQGYREPKGNQLRRERRELQSNYWKNCR